MHLEIDVAVGVEGNAHIRVAESLLDDAGMDAGSQRQRGVGVAQIVQPDRR